MTFINKLKNYHQASYSSLFVATHEENRLVKDIYQSATADATVSVHEWDAQHGLVWKAGPKEVRHPEDTKMTAFLLEYLQGFNQKDTIFILKDFHLHFDKVINIRLLRNAWNELKGRRNMIIFTGHKFAVPAELQKEIQLLDYDLPTGEAILERLMFIKDSVNRELVKAERPPIEITPEVTDAAVEAAKGMTYYEVENAFAMAYTTNKAFDSGFVATVFQEKIMQLKKNGLLTYMEPNISFADVGGLQGLKTWLHQRKSAYSKDARAYNLPLPKGMLLASVPGTGKTLICKAIAKEFDCPLFALDIGSIFDSLVGNSEKNMRELIKTVESIGKCVILVD